MLALPIAQEVHEASCASSARHATSESDDPSLHPPPPEYLQIGSGTADPQYVGIHFASVRHTSGGLEPTARFRTNVAATAIIWRLIAHPTWTRRAGPRLPVDRRPSLPSIFCSSCAITLMNLRSRATRLPLHQYDVGDRVVGRRTDAGLDSVQAARRLCDACGETAPDAGHVARCIDRVESVTVPASMNYRRLRRTFPFTRLPCLLPSPYDRCYFIPKCPVHSLRFLLSFLVLSSPFFLGRLLRLNGARRRVRCTHTTGKCRL